MSKMPDTTSVETLAEVLCNVAGVDPNNEVEWAFYLQQAQIEKDEVAAGLIEPWWSEDAA